MSQTTDIDAILIDELRHHISAKDMADLKRDAGTLGIPPGEYVQHILSAPGNAGDRYGFENGIMPFEAIVWALRYKRTANELAAFAASQFFENKRETR